MGRKPLYDYIDAARQVLAEFGGGPLSSKDLVRLAQERGLIGEEKWVYHCFLRAVRGNEEFDTSVRGQISVVFPDSTPEVPERELVEDLASGSAGDPV